MVSDDPSKGGLDTGWVTVAQHCVRWHGSALCCLPAWLAAQQPVVHLVTVHDTTTVGLKGRVVMTKQRLSLHLCNPLWHCLAA